MRAGVAKRTVRAGDGVTFPTTGSDVHVHFTCFLVHEDTPEANGEEEDEDEDEEGGGSRKARKTEVDTSRGTTPMTSPSGITMLKKAVPFRIRQLGVADTGGGTGSGSSIKTKVISGWEHALPTMSLGERASFLFAPEAAYGTAGKGQRSHRTRRSSTTWSWWVSTENANCGK